MKSLSRKRIILIVIALVLATPLAKAQDSDPLTQKGSDDQKAENYDQSIQDYTQAIATNPQDAKAYSGRAYVYVKTGEDDKAIADLSQAVQIDPKYQQAYYRRSFVYMIKGNYEAAGADLTNAIQINPNFVKAYYRRATVEMLQGKDDEAIADLDKVLQLQPDFDSAKNRRSFALMLKGDYAGAISAIDDILAKKPQVPAYNRLAWLLATCPDATIRDGKKAVELSTKANELTGWKMSSQLDTLAAAYAEAGDFASAIKWENEATTHQADTDKIDAEKSRLALYQAFKPYHVEKYDPKFEAVIL